MWLRSGFLLNLKSRMPTIASAPVRKADEKTTGTPSPGESDARQAIQPVMLVPTIEPRLMLTASLNCIRPEFTKPMTMTLVAEDDCISAVTPMPRRMPLTGFPDT